ncbi:spinster family MFS transporter [Litorivivens sp.]|uniref:spinster family MFS transporter n=3 Tax=Litorivivens sp. TaxID=2020868 RepID=UPI00356A29A1
MSQYRADRRAWYALCVLTVVYAFNFIDRQLLAILQEAIKADLGLSDSQLGLLTGFAFALFYVTAGIPIARWADRSNRRNIVALSLAVWSFMTAISGLVNNYVQLLLARVGVGIGEAGGSPPSHSMISDMFPPEQRAGALGFYSTGVSIGILFGFLLGGWLNEFFGWRVAFMVVGAPGLILALVVRFTVTEPRRGMSEAREMSDDSTSLRDVVALLWQRKTFRHMAFAASLYAFAGYATANWTASFMIRTHGMSTGELGSWLALIIGFGGAVGVLGGGVLADRLGARDDRWYLWVPAIVGVVATPFATAVYLMPSAGPALAMMVVPAVLSNVYLGITIATSHRLVGLQMRATSSAILFFVLNIIGLGGGPWIVGLVSDALAGSYGLDSLRLAMLYVVPPVMLWSASHFYLASRHLRTDLLAAPQ